MHLVYDELTGAVDLPWFHIADATGEALRRDGVRKVGLLGTRFTMDQPFYRERLAKRFGLEVVVPEAEDRQTVDDTIFSELVRGHFTDESRERFRSIVARVAGAGAESIILGCTEIGLLISSGDSPVPIYDTTKLHAAAAVEHLLSEGGE
jgi:aspartate racemase